MLLGEKFKELSLDELDEVSGGISQPYFFDNIDIGSVDNPNTAELNNLMAILNQAKMWGLKDSYINNITGASSLDALKAALSAIAISYTDEEAQIIFNYLHPSV